MSRVRWTWRELRDEVRQTGSEVLRTKGSHEIWRLPSGAHFTIVRNHLKATVPSGILAQYRRRRDCWSASDDDEPVLPGLAGSW